MYQTPLYPLRFDPIYQYRPWGGRRLSNFLSAPLPSEGPFGEAWILSDRDDFPSRVTEGPLKDLTIKDLIDHSPEGLLGKFSTIYSRFPLLLKFLDVAGTLSVQVHPSDHDTKYIPDGEHGKTEAWVVLEPGPEACVYAGLQEGTTEDSIRQAISSGTVSDQLTCFKPGPGDAVFIPARTVHSLGDVVVFEVQENSDVTFRLYDWDHIDTKTGQPRPLQVTQAMDCIDFMQGAIGPVIPHEEVNDPILRERLFDCDHFVAWRVTAEMEFVVGKEGTPRVLVCISGEADLKHDDLNYAIRPGNVILLPAAVGACFVEPLVTITLLEIGLPEGD